jgi:hypothetical protein
MFTRKMSFAPTPQPGRYPIVFPAGAGEPTRDAFFAIDGCSLKHSFSDVGANYVASGKFAEFAANAEYEANDFKRDMVVSALLATMQQVVNAHANMGLIQGDYSSIANTDFYVTAGVQHIVNQFGEFPVESVGTRFLFKDYDSEIRALMRTAKKVHADYEHVGFYLNTHWLPTKANDERTKFILANKINGYFHGFGVQINVDTLVDSLFTRQDGTIQALIGVLPELIRAKFGQLFEPYEDRAQFVQKFSGQAGQALLTVLGLSWQGPAVDHMVWDLIPKVEFPKLADLWMKKRPTMSKFFNCTSGLAQKSETLGSSSQLSKVSTRDGVTVVKTRFAITAPEYSLLACFNSSGIFPREGELNAVVSTTIPVQIRGTEFLQRDWMA